MKKLIHKATVILLVSIGVGVYCGSAIDSAMESSHTSQVRRWGSNYIGTVASRSPNTWDTRDGTFRRDIVQYNVSGSPKQIELLLSSSTELGSKVQFWLDAQGNTTTSRDDYTPYGARWFGAGLGLLCGPVVALLLKNFTPKDRWWRSKDRWWRRKRPSQMAV